MARCESAIHDGTILTERRGGTVDGKKRDIFND
jgi:hypothetical protein